jgi:hypothetical protein
MPVADRKTFKIYGKIWLWKKKIIRISYQKAHHFPASCVLYKFLRFIEKKKYVWLIPNPLSRKRRSTKSPHGFQYGGNSHHETISEWPMKRQSTPLGKKHTQHKKQGPHSLFLQTGNLPSTKVVRVFPLESLI